MKIQLRQALSARINAIEDEDELLELFGRLGYDLDESLIASEMVWAKIKLADDVSFLEQDKERSKLEGRHIQQLARDTKGVKLFKSGEWYINKNLSLRLRATWINIIEE